MNGKSNLSRRDFIKLLSLLPFTYFLPAQTPKSSQRENGSKQKNVLIFVFDALSALDMPIYGFHRNTTPNLTQLAEKAIVYHNHYAGGNYTTPGTASLLTGTYSWTHRAIKLNNEVLENLQSRNIFHEFPTFHRFSYTHNNFADRLLNQFHRDINDKLNIWELFLSKDRLFSTLSKRDFDTASLLEHLAFDTSNPSTYSLFLSRFVKDYLERSGERIHDEYLYQFPRGLPSMTPQSYRYYLLEDTMDWLKTHAEGFPQPFLGYIHVLPPHHPYRTRREFIDIFKDGWKPIEKPRLFETTRAYTEEGVVERRRQYDEFIAYVDAEFNRLLDALRESNILENTIVVFTTDHGEMFERGIWGHDHPFLYQPVIKIPLVIFHPEQNERVDVNIPTSAVDVLPTLLHATGQATPSWCEGEILPPFNTTIDGSERSVYALEAKTNPKPTAPITRATGMIVQGRYKLTKYFGYDALPPGEPLIELYDLENDPEELENLYSVKRTLANELLNELETRMQEADEPYL